MTDFTVFSLIEASPPGTAPGFGNATRITIHAKLHGRPKPGRRHGLWLPLEAPLLWEVMFDVGNMTWPNFISRSAHHWVTTDGCHATAGQTPEAQTTRSWQAEGRNVRAESIITQALLLETVRFDESHWSEFEAHSQNHQQPPSSQRTEPLQEMKRRAIFWDALLEWKKEFGGWYASEVSRGRFGGESPDSWCGFSSTSARHRSSHTSSHRSTSSATCNHGPQMIPCSSGCALLVFSFPCFSQKRGKPTKSKYVLNLFRKPHLKPAVRIKLCGGLLDSHLLFMNLLTNQPCCRLDCGERCWSGPTQSMVKEENTKTRKL